jgi:chromate reductase, NAD(P)H dehydrogenase (quinone)
MRSISGSLRAAASNSALLRAMISLAPRRREMIVFSKLAEVPHCNADLDIELGPPPVLHLRTELALTGCGYLYA